MPAEDTRAVAGFCSEEPQRLKLNPLVEASRRSDVCIQDLQEVSTRTLPYTWSYASVFEVFKKDVDLDYDELKKKFKLIGDNDILQRLGIACRRGLTDYVKPADDL